MPAPDALDAPVDSPSLPQTILALDHFDQLGGAQLCLLDQIGELLRRGRRELVMWVSCSCETRRTVWELNNDQSTRTFWEASFILISHGRWI
jgi:hypothetical protein